MGRGRGDGRGLGRNRDRSREALRLWTTKEALFKANAANEGTLLTHYVLDEPGAATGTARWTAEAGSAFRYASLPLAGGGALTLAVRFPMKGATS
jgi:hypothetical protein